MSEVTYRADTWIMSDGSALCLTATLTAFISDIQVTLVDAHKGDGDRCHYWQRTALVDWVGCHQHTLRRLQQASGYGLDMAQ